MLPITPIIQTMGLTEAEFRTYCDAALDRLNRALDIVAERYDAEILFQNGVLSIDAAGITSGRSLAQRPIDDYFNDFTSGWVRSSPNQAIATRYFTGAEQDRLEQQLSPETVEYRRTRIQLAKHGLEGLRHFDR